MRRMNKKTILWIACFLSLTACDIASKKYITGVLNYHPTAGQISFSESPGAALYNGKDELGIVGDNGSIIKFRLFFNDRFAFSLGPSLPSLGLLVHLLAFCLAAFYRFKNPALGSVWIWLFISAGAAGNFIDKLFVKSLSTREWIFSLTPLPGHITGVVDFIECIWFGFDSLARIPVLNILSWHSFAIFNLADAMLTTGIALLVWTVFRTKDRAPAAV